MVSSLDSKAKTLKKNGIFICFCVLKHLNGMFLGNGLYTNCAGLQGLFFHEFETNRWTLFL